MSSYESAAEKISVDVNTAFAENAPIGTIINTKLAEATAREEERTENTEDKDRDETAAPEQASVSVPSPRLQALRPQHPPMPPLSFKPLPLPPPKQSNPFPSPKDREPKPPCRRKRRQQAKRRIVPASSASCVASND